MGTLQPTIDLPSGRCSLHQKTRNQYEYSLDPTSLPKDRTTLQQILHPSCRLLQDGQYLQQKEIDNNNLLVTFENKFSKEALCMKLQFLQSDSHLVEI